MNRPFALVVLSCCLPLLGQDPATGSRVEERAQSMRDQIGTGRPVQSHVRVMVRLKNGNRLNGVVKDGKLVERVDGLRFVEAQAQDKGAGIRLWYSGGARNYVFVPFSDFAEYEVQQQLTQKQIEQIETDMQMNERRAAERAAATARAATGTAEGAPAAPTGESAPSESVVGVTQEPAPAATGTTTVKTKKSAKANVDAAPAKLDAQQVELELHRTWFALVQAYPPAQGWNEKKRDEISRRFVVIGSKPSEAEQKFVDNYDQWVKACAHFAVKAPTAGTEGTGASGEATDDKKGRRKK